ncbi:hypothetical protein Pmani_039826 [Petrolisthes manimaculis]|uniref:Uncharacterized protein n=1 Tax=Petrolisthes manimaculis TaxID=1843537 RepID=A0AAE1NBS3_9EUCA|nr:hypothetical protein Pmani_039826 [Petrolisthes manimaculis]
MTTQNRVMQEIDTYGHDQPTNQRDRAGREEDRGDVGERQGQRRWDKNRTEQRQDMDIGGRTRGGGVGIERWRGEGGRMERGRRKDGGMERVGRRDERGRNGEGREEGQRNGEGRKEERRNGEEREEERRSGEVGGRKG